MADAIYTRVTVVNNAICNMVGIVNNGIGIAEYLWCSYFHPVAFIHLI